MIDLYAMEGMRVRYKAVIFDFDGTVADTCEGIFDSVQFALRSLNKEPIDMETLRKFIGPPLLFGFREYAHLNDTEAEQAVELYRKNYEAGAVLKLRFYDGLLELLQKLRDNGIRTGLASAKPDVFIQKILSHYEIRDLFDCARGISLQDYCTDKTHVINAVLERLGIKNRQEVLMVGDTLFDIEGAKSVGTASAGVLYGFGNPEQLRASGADYIVQDIAELDAVIFNQFAVK